LVARATDGITDVLMGLLCDRTKSKYGKFRPWVLWTAIPLAVSLSLLFTTPDLGPKGKIVYAYATYLLFILVYTANNVPYGALMAVMTGDDKQRTSLGSYRMVGAFTGGLVVQGALLFLVAYFGNINPRVDVEKLDSEKYILTVSTDKSVDNVNIRAGARTFFSEGNALLQLSDQPAESYNLPRVGWSLSMEAGKEYSFIVTGEDDIKAKDVRIIDQKRGYSNSIYLLSVFLALFLVITFATTRERVQPPKSQNTNLLKDMKDLAFNRPWLVLLFIGLIFNTYNAIKQGTILYYFSHFLHNQLLASFFMVGLMLASIAGAMVTSYLSRLMGKRNLFVAAFIFSGSINALFWFCGPDDIVQIFAIGLVSEFGAAIFPTLFFAMLGDAADYSEFVNNRRATGLVYSAGSLATKFGGGIAGAIIGMVLAAFSYDGLNHESIRQAVPGIIMLMSWIPAVIALLGAIVMAFYPLTTRKMEEITAELARRRATETY
jgi:GPH family glycoside/pentoside/hexuronide:cation symporter